MLCWSPPGVPSPPPVIYQGSAALGLDSLSSAQKAPAGRLSGSKYDLIRPKGPCGTHFYPQIQFHPPKRPLRDACLTQNTILSTQKAAAGRISSPKYNSICPTATCGRTFCHSQIEIFDIGTEILCKTCFGHNSTQNGRTSMIPMRFCRLFCVDSESAVKTRFEALFKILPSWIRSLSTCC